MTEEKKRLQETRKVALIGRNGVPLPTERQWGTVRRTIAQRRAWDNVTHDDARSKAYRWGEEGIGGFPTADSLPRLGILNGKDPYQREALWIDGLQGNHAEDEGNLLLLDSTPHSYMKMLYKYPKTSFLMHKF